jgi:PKD repeat protein
LEATAPGLYEASYVIRSTLGEAGQSVTRRGMTVQRALEQAEVTSFGFLTVPRPDGSTVYLPALDFAEPSPFEGGKFAVFSVDSGSTRFLRPLLAGDASDINAPDNIATVSGEALVVGVHDGDVLAVQATASPTSTAVGAPIQFTATASGGLPGEGFNFEWSFGDGSTAVGETVSHTFAGSGTYEVRVTAAGTAGSGGESGPLDVVVGDPPTTAQPGATSTPQPQPKPKRKKPAGADGTGGHEGRGGTGTRSRHGGGGRRDAARSPTQRREGSASSPDSSEPAAPATTTPEPVTPAAPPAQDEPSHPTRKDGGRPQGEGRTDHVAPRSGTAATETVEGRLVGDDLGPVAPEEAVGGSSPGQGSRSAAGAVAGGGIGLPVVALIVVALLAGGALFEWRNGRPIR